jgi:hypothetical protein
MTAIRALGLCAALLAVAVRPGPAGEPEKPAPAPAADAENEKQKARIAELVGQLGDKEWARREAAGEELLRIGRPAEAAVAEAAAGKDAEAATRAAELLKKIKALPERKPIDPNGTDGYQMVYGDRTVVQTFKAPAEKLDAVRFRLARTWTVPADDLVVELREPGKPEPLAAATLYTDWLDWTQKPEGAKSAKPSRFFKWVAADLKAAGLQKGKTYELAWRSEKSEERAPWLVNCFYRDTYPDGEQSLLRDGRPVKSDLKCDLVFELVAGEARTGSAPKDADLNKKEEHFGLGPDGVDRRGKPPEGTDLPKSAFF